MLLIEELRADGGPVLAREIQLGDDQIRLRRAKLRLGGIQVRTRQAAVLRGRKALDQLR